MYQVYPNRGTPLDADCGEIGVQQVDGVTEQEDVRLDTVAVVGILARARVGDSRQHVPLVALVGMASRRCSR